MKQSEKTKFWLSKKKLDKLRVWDENIHMNKYQVDKEKGPTE